MTDIIKDSELEWRTPTKVIYNGTLYIYVMNTSIRNLSLIEEAVVAAGVRAIYTEHAYDMCTRPMPDYVSVCISDNDYQTGTCVSRIINESTRLIKEYKARLVSEGKISEDTLLCDIYYGCEDDPEFLAANAPAGS
jgi:hypothetical protein